MKKDVEERLYLINKKKKKLNNGLKNLQKILKKFEKKLKRNGEKK